MSTFGKAVLRLLPQELNQRRAARSIDRPARRQSRPTVPVTGPPTGCRRPAVDAGLDPWPLSRIRARICWAAVATEGSSSPSSAACRARPESPDEFLGFFRDCRGREMAAGVQAAGISDDLETERAYLNMEAR